MAAELAQVEAEIEQYRKEMDKWGRRVEMARANMDIPEDLRQGASKFYASKRAVVTAGEKYRAYLIVELDQLRLRERKPYDVN